MADQAEAVRLNDLYETDFYEWTQEQARLLRERRFADLDLDNLIDEVGSVGFSEKREIRNRLAVLIAHLLKWKFQPGRRGESWRETIHEQRLMLLDIVDSSPSLKIVRPRARGRDVPQRPACSGKGDPDRVRRFSRGKPVHARAGH